MLIDLKAIDIVLLIAAGAVALTAPALGAWRGRSGHHWGPAIALGTGYFAFQYAIAHPGFPPLEATDRILWLGLAAMVLGLFESVVPGPAWTRWENRLLITSLVVWAILGPVLIGAEEPRPEWIRVAVFVLALLLSWANLGQLTARASLKELGPAMIAVCGGTAGVFVLSGWAVGFQLAAGLAILMGLVWVVSWFAKGLSLERGADPVIVTLIGSMLLSGHTYASTPGWSALLIAVAPAGFWASRIKPVARLRPWLSFSIGLFWVVGIVSAAVGIAVAVSPSFGES